METLKIGFIGSGFIARFMAETMCQVRQVEITAIYRRSGAQKLAEYARSNFLGEPVLCDSIREVCQKCDAVAIFSPNHTRLQVMQEIADVVKEGADLTGVICEKPLARTIQRS